MASSTFACSASTFWLAPLEKSSADEFSKFKTVFLRICVCCMHRWLCTVAGYHVHPNVVYNKPPPFRPASAIPPATCVDRKLTTCNASSFYTPMLFTNKPCWACDDAVPQNAAPTKRRSSIECIMSTVMCVCVCWRMRSSIKTNRMGMGIMGNRPIVLPN